MTREQVLLEIKQLSLPDKMSVLAVLTRLIEIEEQDTKYKDLTDFYVSKMKELAGDSFLSNNKRESAQAKVVMSICLMEKGMTVTQIGRILNRDHSTVTSYKKVWKNALSLPRVYRDMIELYNKYKKAICQ